MRLSPLIRFSVAIGAAGLAGLLLATMPSGQSVASNSLEARKLPMRFSWIDCKPDCKGWVSALGIVTAETPGAFEAFAKERDLSGATIVLDSSGGSVNDALTLGRRFRELNALTSVGTTVDARGDGGPAIQNTAYCESMCVFLLLAGKTRYVPEGARVRVHQIWMGDRAEDARAASYSAQDLMIVERDIGRLAKFTFDMGGTGDLLALALSVPPWEDLHEMSRDEMRAANLLTTEIRPDALPTLPKPPAMATLAPKPTQDRFTSDDVREAKPAMPLSKPTKTAEATGGNAPTTPDK